MPQAAELRTRLTEAGARFRVVKNTLTERAADQAGAEALKELLEGPTAFTSCRDGGDVALAAKALATFRREHDVLGFKGGVMDGDALTVDQLEALVEAARPRRAPRAARRHGRLADHRPGPRPERADQRPGDPAGPDRATRAWWAATPRRGAAAEEAPAAEAPAEEAPAAEEPPAEEAPAEPRRPR